MKAVAAHMHIVWYGGVYMRKSAGLQCSRKSGSGGRKFHPEKQQWQCTYMKIPEAFPENMRGPERERRAGSRGSSERGKSMRECRIENCRKI